ncbi:hypothetical protein ACWC5I_41745, partial [Kitasatospora sp. NPDC001574]
PKMSRVLHLTGAASVLVLSTLVLIYSDAPSATPTPDVRLPLLPAGPAEVARALELATGLDH